MKTISILRLKMLIIGGGFFDLFGGMFFIFFVGANRAIEKPFTHPFYAILLGVFLICFAYLQFSAVMDIRKSMWIIGVIFVSRIFYGLMYFSFLFFTDHFPTIFLPTAVADIIFAISYLIFPLLSNEIRLRDMFVLSPAKH